MRQITFIIVNKSGGKRTVQIPLTSEQVQLLVLRPDGTSSKNGKVFEKIDSYFFEDCGERIE